MSRKNKIDVIFTDMCVMVTSDDRNYKFKLNTSIVKYRELRKIIAKICENRECGKDIEKFNTESDISIIDILEYIYSAIFVIDSRSEKWLSKYKYVLDSIPKCKYTNFAYDTSFAGYLIEGIKTVADVYY